MTDQLKAALWTALFTFIGLFGTSVLGFVQAVIEWANAGGGPEVFPDATVLGKAAVSAAGAAVVGLINFVVRFAQSKQLLPGQGPTYPPA